MTGFSASPDGVNTAAKLLAIDCSSEQAGLALFDGERVTELSWPAGRSQTTSVLAAIQHLLSINSLEISNISAVGVTIGPGPFSGLRVGLSIAKGLLLGLGMPIIGVPTLAAAALPFAGLVPIVVPLVPAGRGRIAWSAYGQVDAYWTEVMPVRNSTLDEMLATLPDSGQVLVTGELSAEQEQVLQSSTRILLPAPALRTRRPAAVASIAWGRFMQGDVDDAVTLQAMYAGRDSA